MVGLVVTYMAYFAQPGSGNEGVPVTLFARISADDSASLELERFKMVWSALRQVLHTPWWSRCWISQELLSSGSRTVIDGNISISGCSRTYRLPNPK